MGNKMDRSSQPMRKDTLPAKKQIKALKPSRCREVVRCDLTKTCCTQTLLWTARFLFIYFTIAFIIYVSLLLRPVSELPNGVCQIMDCPTDLEEIADVVLKELTGLPI